MSKFPTTKETIAEVKRTSRNASISELLSNLEVTKEEQNRLAYQAREIQALMIEKLISDHAFDCFTVNLTRVRRNYR